MLGRFLGGSCTRAGMGNGIEKEKIFGENADKYEAYGRRRENRFDIWEWIQVEHSFEFRTRVRTHDT